MKNGQKSSLHGETSLYSEEIPFIELFSKIHYIDTASLAQLVKHVGPEGISVSHRSADVQNPFSPS